MSSTNMPPVSFGVAKFEEIWLSEDGSHICVPPILIDYSSGIFHKQSLTNMQISIPEVIDMDFFEKFATFIV